MNPGTNSPTVSRLRKNQRIDPTSNFQFERDQKTAGDNKSFVPDRGESGRSKPKAIGFKVWLIDH